MPACQLRMTSRMCLTWLPQVHACGEPWRRSSPCGVMSVVARQYVRRVVGRGRSALSLRLACEGKAVVAVELEEGAAERALRQHTRARDSAAASAGSSRARGTAGSSRRWIPSSWPVMERRFLPPRPRAPTRGGRDAGELAHGVLAHAERARERIDDGNLPRSIVPSTSAITMRNCTTWSRRRIGDRVPQHNARDAGQVPRRPPARAAARSAGTRRARRGRHRTAVAAVRGRDAAHPPPRRAAPAPPVSATSTGVRRAGCGPCFTEPLVERRRATD